VGEGDRERLPGRAEQGDEVAPPASPWLAVGTMTLIALVAALAVLGWARLRPGAEAAPAPTAMAEEIPTELAGGEELGEVPQEVAAAFDEPVVAARLLDELPEGFEGCGFHDIVWSEPPELELAVLSTDGLYVSQVGEGGWVEGGMDMPMPAPDPEPGQVPADDDSDAGAQRLRVTCHAAWEGRGWGGSGGSSGPALDDIPELGGGGSTCCDRNGLATGQTAVRAPDGAAWAVQERGGWWLAYPLDEHGVAALTWKYREGRFGGGIPPTHVLYLDEAGETIDEAWVGN
jgi:hypothetical protein